MSDAWQPAWPMRFPTGFGSDEFENITIHYVKYVDSANQMHVQIFEEGI